MNGNMKVIFLFFRELVLKIGFIFILKEKKIVKRNKVHLLVYSPSNVLIIDWTVIHRKKLV